MSVRAKFQSWIDRLLDGRSSRERQFLVWGAALSLLLLLVVGFWMPLKQAQSRMERSVAIERKRLAVMGAAKLELASIDNRARQSSRPALARQLLEEHARHRLAPITLDIQVENAQRVRIAFSGAKIPRLIEWIDELSRIHGIHVVFARLRPDGGEVSGEIQFSGTDS